MQQFLTILLYIILAFTSLFLICLVLIQRGKGGGLAGAFGGAGGSSAFGTKAGDVFTRVTMIVAGVWIALNMILVVVSGRKSSAWGNVPGAASKSDVVPPIPTPFKEGTPVEKLDIPGGGSVKVEPGGNSPEPIPPTEPSKTPPK